MQSDYRQTPLHHIFVDKQIRVPTFTMTYEHTHPYCEFFYLRTGSCVYYINGNMIHLSAGDFFIIPPETPHYTSYEGLTPCERIGVNCYLDTLPSDFWKHHELLFDNLARPGKIILTKTGRILAENILERMIEENNIPDEHSSEFLNLLMMELLLNFRRSGTFIYEQIKPKSEFGADIESILRYIAQNYSLPITLEELAQRASLSPTYLSRKFKQATGITFKEYLNYIRIKRASQALITTDDSITKIAVDCGFNSSNYFKDIFRKINGISPRAFRKSSADRTFSYDIPQSKSIPKWTFPVDQSNDL